MALSCSKKLSALSTGIMSKHHSDFYCLNFPHSFATENKRESHKNIYQSKVFCNVVIHSENTKILELYIIKNLIKHQLLFVQIMNF